MTQDDNDNLSENLSTTFTASLDDYAALLRFISRSGSRIVWQALFLVVVGLYLMAITILIGIVIAFFNPTSGRLAAVSDYLRTKALDDLAPIAPWIGLFCLAVFLLNVFVLVPRQCRLLAKRSLSFYPEVRQDDPTMTMTTHLSVTRRGIEGATRDERVFVAWPLVRRLVERRDCYYLMTSKSTAMILPKAALASEPGSRILDAIRQALAQSRDAAR